MTHRRYLIADYERRNFSVSQCSWNAGAQQEIVAIISPSEAISVSRIQSAKHGGLSSGQIAGTVIAGLAGSLIVLAIILKVKWSKTFQRSIKTEVHELEASEKPDMEISEIDGRDQQEHELDGYRYPGHEIDGQKLPGHELGGVESSCELSGEENLKHELPALEFPGGEMPLPETRSAFESHEMP